MSDLSFIHGQGSKNAPNLIEHKQQAITVVLEALTTPSPETVRAFLYPAASTTEEAASQSFSTNEATSCSIL
ncbi:hypothetical protein GCM10008018_28190 [Paenibacillus marchantiophytorum]|uniref:Uncharacterized protein n=1 Tax=Paenibacillus marchantiophytorum TaxID=1619310 RepID=A0ABQ1EPK8_9BACL|nr:hypothetical protein [Paenibacillus marchantiophytorum]GFZ81042.1 hypothetical protein GCM10008018_28190 [Paenibacillus marchantiophytorum]